MRPFAEFTHAFFDEPVLVTIEDVSAVFHIGAGGERTVTINVVGGAILTVREDYETVKARLKGEPTG